MISNSGELSETVQCARGLKFCTLNARSLNNKFAEFVDFVCDRKPDLVAIKETWFTDDESASRALCTPEDCKLLDCSHLCRLKGGTGVLVRNSIITANSDEESPTFGHANANFSAFMDRIRIYF